MKKILVIQSRKSSERQQMEQHAFERAADDVASLDFISTLDVEQSWDSPAEMMYGYDGVILGGSSDFFWHYETDELEEEYKGARTVLARVRTLIEYLIERQVPLLGICFGHQLVAELFGGSVTHDGSQKKAGSHEVQLTEAGRDDVLLGDTAPSFHAQYAHKNSITRPPFGAVVLGNGPACHFAALRYGEKCYTFQFHPELIAQDLLSQPEALAVYMKEGETVEQIVRETPVANGLIRAFVEKVAGVA